MDRAKKNCFLMIIVFVTALLCSSLSAVCFANSTVVGFITDGSNLDDDSFNSITLVGLRMLQKDYGIEKEIRCGGFTAESFLNELNSLLAKKIKIIVVNTTIHRDLIAGAIKDHPDVIFILNEIIVDGYPNASSIKFDQKEGSCLVGALCAWQSKTGKIGFIGGNESPSILDFLCGFKEGVRFAGKKCDIDIKFIRSGMSIEGFEDPQRGNELAKEMYDSGVDIIYSVAGLSGNGIIYAAQQSGKYVVGVDSDQDYIAKGTVLTSMRKRLDLVVYHEVESVLIGKFKPGVKQYGLQNGGVALSNMDYTRCLIPEIIRDRLKNLERLLKSGKITFNCSEK
ncbi:BMP family lipoprotein [Desulfovibrio gilichinskyi]|uniref:Nucleoside-binding protein n=1 Tax=Desulfovibrio gilichinskyi TaxID=1519643 RepID=A0A1X7DIV5_9BACT|nr:BMP family ABC transporter substrate-binding protein [Desulfovibrio gilichinskyi]SMF15745.1 nucleoside-binding protein [Desulfovibrio gilichinskyi]